MKNLLLLCVLFFAFQNVGLAQGNFGITLGGGLHIRNNIGFPGEDAALQAKVGIDYQRNLSNEKF